MVVPISSYVLSALFPWPLHGRLRFTPDSICILWHATTSSLAHGWAISTLQLGKKYSHQQHHCWVCPSTAVGNHSPLQTFRWRKPVSRKNSTELLQMNCTEKGTLVNSITLRIHWFLGTEFYRQEEGAGRGENGWEGNLFSFFFSKFSLSFHFSFHLTANKT